MNLRKSFCTLFRCNLLYWTCEDFQCVSRVSSWNMRRTRHRPGTSVSTEIRQLLPLWRLSNASRKLNLEAFDFRISFHNELALQIKWPWDKSALYPLGVTQTSLNEFQTSKSFLRPIENQTCIFFIKLSVNGIFCNNFTAFKNYGVWAIKF